MKNQEPTFAQEYLRIKDQLYGGLFRGYQQQQLGVLEKLNSIRTFNPLKILRNYRTKRELRRSLAAYVAKMDELVDEAIGKILKL
jgi:hypothetical protein